MKPFQIQKKRAEKRRREEARRERRKGPKQAPVNFRVLTRTASGETSELLVESVIVKNPDASVHEAVYDEIEAGMTLVLENARGLIEHAVVEEKIDSTEEGVPPTLRARPA